MNENVISYLRENKDKFPRETLIEELKKSGYSEVDINEGVEIVYENKDIPSPVAITSFWDFKTKKIYGKASEKVADFFLGFFAPWLLNIVFFPLRFISSNRIVSSVLGFVALIAEIFIIIYLFKKRKFISYGLIANFLLMFVFIAGFITLLLLFWH